MKLKGKLIAGISFFFLMLILVAGAALYFNYLLKSDAQAIVQDNYESLEYCHRMQQLLNDTVMVFADSTQTQFENQLTKQNQNITEVGEKAATQKLNEHYALYKLQPSDSLRRLLHQDLLQVISINMQAIHKKNEVAMHTAGNASDWIKILCAFIFLVGFSFVVNFPGIIISPINRLQEGIAEIINKNFKHRVWVKGNDELAELGNAFNMMATRLHDYETSSLSRIMFEKSRAEAVVNSLQDASIGLDNSDRILFANQQALDLLGMKAVSLVGANVRQAMLTNDLLRFVVEHENTAPFKIVVQGREQFFVKEKTAITKDGEQLGTLYTLRNITNFQEKDTAKTNFIAMVSHELKTPLASIRMSADLLHNEKVGTMNAEQQALVTSIQEDTARLLKITGELLNISQVETGHIQLQTTSTEIGALLDYALHANKAQAGLKQITLQQSLAAGLPLVKADAEKAIWVISNLVSNAIRHSPKGAQVLVEAKRGDGGIIVSVTDTGPGIAPAYHQKIFERYFRVPGSDKGGTGLGLATSKELMDAMGGSISLQSEPGKGSRFSIHFVEA